jgi:6-pyruvoyltetrahydropterin/6-carboxytetrahydropterin synthase
MMPADHTARYRVSLQKQQLVFSSAHFITFNGNICESLHGHNYGLKCDVIGPLDENGYVVDFIALRDALAEIAGRLDHRMLLPTKHAAISVAETGDEIEVRFETRRWVFPKNDCVLLPISNTTAELLAWWIGQELISRTRNKLPHQLERIVVSVDENNGQWGECELSWA